MEKTYSLRQDSFYKLSDLVDRLNRKAAKLGLATLTLTVVGKELRDLHSTGNLPGEKVKTWFLDVVLNGEVPSLNGWSFQAKLDHTEDAGNLVFSFSEDLPEIYRTRSPRCEHCNQDRARKLTYVLRNEAGEYKQVGSSCLADFTGALDPHKKAAFLEGWAEILDFTDADPYEAIPGGKAQLFVNWRTVLAVTIACVRKWGWAPAQSLVPTKWQVYDQIFVYGYGSKDRLPLDEGEYELAQKVLDWAEAAFPNPRNDYEWNLAVLLGKEEVEANRIGLAASLYPAYLKATEAAVRAKEAGLSDSQYQGTVADKVTVSGKVISVRELEGAYGTTYLYKFLDLSGNVWVWFASGNRWLELEQTVSLKGTIKAHNEFQGEKQTVLTRCKVLEVA